MQLTKFDRWLKESFIYETHIFTLRLPEDGLPRKVIVKDIEAGKTGDYNYRLIIKSKKLTDTVISELKANHLMYATRVVEGRHWYNSLLAPKGKSFTYRWILRFMGLVGGAYIIWVIIMMLQNESLMELLKATLQDLIGG